MNENINPEVSAEEVTSDAETIEETVTEAAESAETAAEEISETAAEEVLEIAAEENSETAAEENSETVAEDTVTEAEEAITPAEDAFETAAEEAPRKKKFPIQIPVIIAACLLIVSLLSYLVFTAFFLKEPEGVTWSSELDGATYYFEFNDDSTFKAYVGSVEITSTYEKVKDAENGNSLTVNTNVCNFYSGAPATYTISGSRLLGNQTLDYSYGEGYDYSLTQAKREKVDLELPKDFVADEALLGEWIFQYYGYDIYKVTFNDDGSMVLEFVQDGIKYNGTYTIDNGNLNFTYYVSDSVAAPLEYSVNGDTLTFLGATFTRPGAEPATPDQQLLAPVE